MKNIILDGDQVTWLQIFGKATVTTIPTTISSSATKETINGKRPCLEGDEAGVASPGCAYISPPFVTPGSGTLKIQALAQDQLVDDVIIEGKRVIVQGTAFDAVFEVQTPAQQPTPSGPVPDPVKSYPGGKGSFMTTNVTVTAG